MNALVWNLSNIGPWTAALGVVLCLTDSRSGSVDWVKCGAYVCLIAEAELGTLLVVRSLA